MSIKKKILIFVSLIIIVTIYGTLKSKTKTQEKAVTEWLNGWTEEAIETRQAYHDKLNAVHIKEIKSENEYFDIDCMKEHRKSLERLLAVEMWKINNLIEINKKWYDKIDSMLKGSIDIDKIDYLKEYLEVGIKETREFKKITSNYFNDQLAFVNFLLEKNCSFTANDERKYNELTSKIETSSTLYNNSVNDIYNNRMKRVKEFNEKLKNENIDILLDIIPDGERN